MVSLKLVVLAVDVEDLHASTSHSPQDTSYEDSIGIGLLSIVIEQVVHDCAVVASLGALCVALGLVAGTSRCDARHCV
jgi:hypothetical protein